MRCTTITSVFTIEVVSEEDVYVLSWEEGIDGRGIELTGNGEHSHSLGS
jgi:hypothetical protein